MNPPVPEPEACGVPSLIQALNSEKRPPEDIRKVDRVLEAIITAWFNNKEDFVVDATRLDELKRSDPRMLPDVAQKMACLNASTLKTCLTNTTSMWNAEILQARAQGFWVRGGARSDIRGILEWISLVRSNDIVQGLLSHFAIFRKTPMAPAQSSTAEVAEGRSGSRESSHETESTSQESDCESADDDETMDSAPASESDKETSIQESGSYLYGSESSGELHQDTDLASKTSGLGHDQHGAGPVGIRLTAQSYTMTSMNLTIDLGSGSLPGNDPLRVMLWNLSTLSSSAAREFVLKRGLDLVELIADPENWPLTQSADSGALRQQVSQGGSDSLTADEGDNQSSVSEEEPRRPRTTFKRPSKRLRLR
ncbi:hypothetical protein OHC33_004925 [Knufia fluminis]|uniref:Uncharacterized protein n=1 Tax=Knufia fluminis TaxID=191047 RepID=A0AAN8INN5_9EURO|nr:hypothetical protein OHC33_004925 [Knufia fluminis]